VLHLARLARLDDEPHLHPRPLADQMMVHGGGREQARNRRVAGVRAAVGEDQDGVPVADGGRGAPAEELEGLLEPLAARARREERGQRHGVQARLVDLANLRQLGVRQARRLQLELARVQRRFLEDVLLRPDGGAERHHQLLADRVDRRVRHLREELLEVVEQELRPLGEARERGVGPHRADRLLRVQRHRRHQEAQVLDRVAEGLLALEERRRIVRRRDRARRRQLAEPLQVLAQPLPIGLPGRHRRLELLVADDAALLEVDEEHAARLQPILVLDVLRRDVEDADLGGHDDEAVLGDDVAARAEPVAVEDGADDAPVREGDRGRAVPGLLQARVVLVERALLVAHRLVALPRLGDHHHDGVGDRAAGVLQELERVVELARVARRRVDDGEELRDVVEAPRGEHGLARVHPVDVAAQRVDLAVVRDEAVGVRAVPGRERVGREALVHEREGRDEQRVGEVVVEGGNLLGEQHPLVDDRPRRQARQVEALGLRHPGGAHPLLHALADGVEAALERVLVGGAAARGDEDLPDVRHDGARDRAGRLLVHREPAPAEELLPLLADHLLEDALALVLLVHLAREEDHADAVRARGGQGDALRLALAA
jgi:hypothetical protein